EVSRARRGDDLPDTVPVRRADNGPQVARIADLIEHEAVFAGSNLQWGVGLDTRYGDGGAVCLEFAERFKGLLTHLVYFTPGRDPEIPEKLGGADEHQHFKI